MTQPATTPDLRPAADTLAALVRGVPGDRLDAPTPCADWTVGDLLDHLMGAAEAFRLAAGKAPDPAPEGPAPPSAARLDPAWRDLLPARLHALALAWQPAAAWAGEVAVGGAVLPAAAMGLVALDELVVHGWDLARATGQPYDPDPRSVEAVQTLVAQQATDAGTPGLFGPAITAPADAPLFERVLGLTGRDPGWKP